MDSQCLTDVVAANNTRILQLLLAVPGSFHTRDINLALIQAIKQGYIESVTCLLGAGADPDFVTPGNTTPLLVAAQTNNAAVAEILLKTGCDVNFRGNGRAAAIHFAAKKGCLEVLEVLVKNKSMVNCQDSSGNTPLILSVRHSQYSAIKILLASGCDVNKVNCDGCTALHYASHKARGFQLLLDAGANPDICDANNTTPLIMAASEGLDGVVRALVDARCDVNIANNSVRRTALHILAYKGHATCVDDLIYGGADINLCDAECHTPLWYAIKNKKLDVIKLLLRANSDVDRYQCSSALPPEACPARLAVAQGMLNVVKLFIVTGYDHGHLRDCLQPAALSDWLHRTEGISDWLDHAAGAQSLKQICRKWIRHHLGRQFYHHLQYLPLPQAMKDYVFMKELDDHC